MSSQNNQTAWNEEERLSALYGYRILDTPKEADFDDIVALVAQVLDAPIAAINLIDRRRQWFKAEIGLGVREMPLDNSICKFVLLESGGMVIPDLRQDERFSCNPLVSGETSLRFYAGELLKTASGLPLGTLCVLDNKPRPKGLTEQQRFALTALARQVMAQMELRISLSQQSVLIEEQKIVQSELAAKERRAVEAVQRAAGEANKVDALLQAAPIGISYVDSNGKVLKVNAGSKRIWGEHPLPESIEEYKDWKGWWADGSTRHGCRLQRNEWAVVRALAGEVITNDIIDIEPFDMPGVRRRCILCASPVCDEKGEITGAVLVQMDISNQKNIEVALRQSEAKFQLMTNAMPQMVWATQPEQETDYFNDRMLEFTGQPKEAITGAGWANFIHPEDLPEASAVWQHALATGTPIENEYRVRHHSGEYRWVLGRALPLRKEDGTTYWMGTFTDINDQRKAAEQLQVANERKDEFLAMLAHELRNPLAPVANAVQLLRLCSGDERRVQEIADIIERQATHMTELVNDLLDVSRISQGLVELHEALVDMKVVIAQAVEQVRPLIEAKGHTLTTTISAKHAIVIGDQTRLIQALSNILTNAAKYSPNGGHIALGCHVCTSEVKISVRDNGAGIDTTLLPYVFDLFTQAQRTPDRAQGGLGLGLTLVKRIIELHKGSVLAESAGEGQGSTFTLSLPIAPANGMPDKAVGREEKTSTSRKIRRILVVDDNIDAAQSLAMLLEGCGHEVLTAADGVNGLEAALSHAPEVVILDIGLPDMDGYELARRLRAEHETRNAVLLALTGYGQEQDKALAEAAGFDFYLVKPISFPELSKLIER